LPAVVIKTKVERAGQSRAGQGRAHQECNPAGMGAAIPNKLDVEWKHEYSYASPPP